MIKKFKEIKMILPPLQIQIGEIIKIISKIKKNKLGLIKLCNEKNEKIDLGEIKKDVIYDLTIKVTAKDKKDDFKIIFGKKESKIHYYNEIDPDKLIKIIEIDELIRSKKVFNITKKINSNFIIINSLVLMTFLSLSPIIKDEYYDNIWVKIGILSYALIAFTLLFFNSYGNTRIIISLKNRFKKFYYRYFSIINLVRAFLTSAIFITIMFLFYNFVNNKFNA